MVIRALNENSLPSNKNQHLSLCNDVDFPENLEWRLLQAQNVYYLLVPKCTNGREIFTVQNSIWNIAKIKWHSRITTQSSFSWKDLLTLTLEASTLVYMYVGDGGCCLESERGITGPKSSICLEFYYWINVKLVTTEVQLSHPFRAVANFYQVSPF